MKDRISHPWNLTPKEAIALQKELAGRVRTGPALDECRFVAGFDLSYNKFSPTCFAAVAIWDVREKKLGEVIGVQGEATFPYIPGLLSFREIPLLMEAFAKLKSKPDALMIDGQGYAHPRRFGVACHLGLLLDLPSIGCAKSRLIGEFAEPEIETGSWSPLIDKEEVIGAVVRSKRRTRPLFISIGHKIDLDSAVRIVLASGAGYRVPEPTRQAHLAVNALRLRAE